MTVMEKIKEWVMRDPRGNILLVLLVASGVLSLILFVTMSSPIIPTILGGAAVLSVTMHIWSLRNLSEQIDTFSKENCRLEDNEERLVEELDVLTANKKKLTTQCDQLQGTVTELTNVSEGLENELKGFANLKTNLEKFAGDTGADVKNILDNADKLHKKMQRMTSDNERSLLGKIAQDLEFMDRDVGMSKYEFDRFMERLPAHCQARFKELGMTFESVAGSDNIIDFMEVEKMLDRLVLENKEKAVPAA